MHSFNRQKYLYILMCRLCVSLFRLKVDELALPQPVQEPLETQPPVGIRRENSGQVEGVWLVVRQPVEEHGQPAEEDVQRAPEHGTQQTCVHVQAGVVGHRQ